ncbi:hypothetical protein [Kribbella sp. NPDC000426]|uniref:hypothetical protein n=1 Tax=Kribbella sp. NPDC000426 TaxID=3154255 RepID=UPI003316C19A
MRNRPIDRRRLLTGIIAATSRPITGCGADLAGQEMASTAGSAVGTITGPLLLRGVIAVCDHPGTATLLATIFNHGDRGDALTSVTLHGGQAVLERQPSPPAAAPCTATRARLPTDHPAGSFCGAPRSHRACSCN